MTVLAPPAGPKKLQFTGLDKFDYYLPAHFLSFIAILFAGLLLEGLLNVDSRAAMERTFLAAGLLVATAVAAASYLKLRHDLLFERVLTSRSRDVNFDRVLKVIGDQGWTVGTYSRPTTISAHTPSSGLSWGELVTVVFVDNAVFVSSVRDPAKRIALFGRHKRNRGAVVQAVI